MKKLLAVFTSLLLLFSFSVFAFGCDKEPSASGGTISGDYKEPTDEELEQVVESLDLNKIFGDPTKEGWKFGASVEADFNVVIDYAGDQIAVDMGLEYKELIENKGTEGFAAAGNGSLDGTFKADAGIVGEDAVNNTVKFKVNNDAEYLYVDASESTGIVTEGAPDKIKVPFSYIMDGLGNLGGDAVKPNPSYPVDTLAQEEESSALIDIDQLKAMLEQYGVTMKVDMKGGIKIQLIASAETLKTVVDAILGSAGAPAEVTNAISFSKSVLEVYLSLSEEGEFAAASIKLDVAASVNTGGVNTPNDSDISTMADTADEQVVNITAKAEININASTDAVTLPDFSDYVDVTASAV